MQTEVEEACLSTPLQRKGWGGGTCVCDDGVFGGLVRGNRNLFSHTMQILLIAEDKVKEGLFRYSCDDWDMI